MQWLVRTHLGAGWGRVGCLNPQREDRITGWLQRKSSLDGIVSRASHEQGVTSFSGSQDGKKPTDRCLLCSDRVLIEPAQLSGQTRCPLFLQSMAAFSGLEGRAFWLLHYESEKRSMSSRTANRRRKHQPERRQGVGGKSLPFQPGCVCLLRDAEVFSLFGEKKLKFASKCLTN